MMRRAFRRALVSSLAGALLLPSLPARADSLKTTGNEIAGGIIAVAAALGVGIGVGVYFAMHPKIKGCVLSGPGGLELVSESDKVTYQLIGATSELKPGELVSVRGRKKHAKGASSDTIFRVDKLKKTYGACSATPNP